MPSPTSDRFYRPELDGLRFFAFLAVYVNHTVVIAPAGHHRHLPDALAHALGDIGVAGAFGVDLFFALSAYLITELLLRERAATGRLDVRAFYVRRILRIWPLYFSFLGLAVVLALLVPSEHLHWKLLLGLAFFSGNWAYMLHPVRTVAAPLWSVSVEEQFYILWPLAVRRSTLRRMAAIAIGLVVLGMAIRLVLALNGVGEPWISKNSFTRVDGIAAGVLLAVVLRGRVPRIPTWGRVALLVGAVATLLWVAADFNLFEGPVLPLQQTLGWPLVAVACATILVASLGTEAFPGSLLRAEPVVYLGRISYGLYVFHEVGLFLGEQAFPDPFLSSSHWVGHFLVGLAVTVGLATASYRWLELPFLRLKQRFTVVQSRPDDASAGEAAAASARAALR